MILGHDLGIEQLVEHVGGSSIEATSAMGNDSGIEQASDIEHVVLSHASGIEHDSSIKATDAICTVLDGLKTTPKNRHEQRHLQTLIGQSMFPALLSRFSSISNGAYSFMRCLCHLGVKTIQKNRHIQHHLQILIRYSMSLPPLSRFSSTSKGGIPSHEVFVPPWGQNYTEKQAQTTPFAKFDQEKHVSTAAFTIQLHIQRGIQLHGAFVPPWGQDYTENPA